MNECFSHTIITSFHSNHRNHHSIYFCYAFELIISKVSSTFQSISTNSEMN